MGIIRTPISDRAWPTAIVVSDSGRAHVAKIQHKWGDYFCLLLNGQWRIFAIRSGARLRGRAGGAVYLFHAKHTYPYQAWVAEARQLLERMRLQTMPPEMRHIISRLAPAEKPDQQEHVIIGYGASREAVSDKVELTDAVRQQVHAWAIATSTIPGRIGGIYRGLQAADRDEQARPMQTCWEYIRGKGADYKRIQVNKPIHSFFSWAKLVVPCMLAGAAVLAMQLAGWF